MYRERLGKKLNKNTLDYLSSLSSDGEIIFYDIIGSQAHVIMLYEKKIIGRNDAKNILQSLEKLKKENFTKKFDVEDIHELIESLIIKKIGTKSGGLIQTGRSRNDQISLDIRMKIRDDINILCSSLLDILKTILSLAEKHQKTIIPLYTHLQQAQVGVFSQFLLAYADSLFRDLDRLYVTYGRVNQSPLGAGPVGGTSLTIDRESTAKLLGFKGIVENSIDATSTRDFAAEYASAIAILMTNLSRISEDFIIWSTSEFGFIELADEFASPSSIMPQKKNPDVLELTRGNTAVVIGNLTSILSIIKGLPSGYNRDLQQMKPLLWSSSKISNSALSVVDSMLSTINVNEDSMKKAASAGGYLLALDLAEKLVKKGVPFRTAHEIIGGLVRVAHKSKKSISDVSFDEIKKLVKEKASVDPKLLQDIIKSTSINSSLQDRSSQGSSGIKEQKRMIQFRIGKVNAYRTGTNKRSQEIKSSLTNLSKRVKELSK